MAAFYSNGISAQGDMSLAGKRDRYHRTGKGVLTGRVSKTPSVLVMVGLLGHSALVEALGYPEWNGVRLTNNPGEAGS